MNTCQNRETGVLYMHTHNRLLYIYKIGIFMSVLKVVASRFYMALSAGEAENAVSIRLMMNYH